MVEHFDLLDMECAGEDGDPTGRVLCIRCYGPGWEPAGASADILDISIAPDLAPNYTAYLMRNVVSFPVTATA